MLSQNSACDSLLNTRKEIHISFAIPLNIGISDLSQMMSIGKIKGDTIDAFLNARQWQEFRKLNIPFSLIYPTSKMKVRKFSASNFQYYPSFQEYENLMYQYQSKFPEFCNIIIAGKSVQGRDIMYARLNHDTLKTKPSVMLSSSIHGDETGGMILMLRLIDYLLNQMSSDTIVQKLMNNLDIWINPLANPDGTYFDSTDITLATRFNANGIDLNRNFPDPVKGNHPDGNAYQPETKAVINLVTNYHFILSANFHSGEEVVNYPWDSQSTLHPDNDWFKSLAQSYADSAIRYGSYGYFETLIGNSSIMGITNGYAWYAVYGGRQDYVTGLCKGREITVEIDDNYITPEENLELLWQSNYRSLLSLLSFALQGISGIVTEADGHPVKASIRILNHDNDLSTIVSDSTYGTFYRLLNPGKYSLAISYYSDTIYVKDIEVVKGKFTNISCLLTVDQKNQLVKDFALYPDPVKNILVLHYSGDIDKAVRYEIINSSGIIVKKDKLTSNLIDVSVLPSGLYVIKLSYPNGSEKHKFIIYR
jgi:hypothetical protein